MSMGVANRLKHAVYENVKIYLQTDLRIDLMKNPPVELKNMNKSVEYV